VAAFSRTVPHGGGGANDKASLSSFEPTPMVCSGCLCLATRGTSIWNNLTLHIVDSDLETILSSRFAILV
jgi:hypothetical protein